LVHRSIQNLIFDLGGVLLNLHVDRTHRAFAELAGIPIEEVKARISKTPFFNDYEKGLHSDDEFRQLVRDFLLTNATPSEIDLAWNAMLGEIPLSRLDLLDRLRSRYRIFLLSNTNAIHVNYFTREVIASGASPLESFFDRVYYSHELKMRKPETGIYEHVLKQHSLNPRATLFLDDNAENLVGAEQIGIQTLQVTHPDLIHSIFHEA
jgi:glucose-1-phosphatase